MIDSIKWFFLYLPIISSLCGCITAIIFFAKGREGELLNCLKDGKKNNEEKIKECEQAFTFAVFVIFCLFMYIFLAVLSGLPAPR